MTRTPGMSDRTTTISTRMNRRTFLIGSTQLIVGVATLAAVHGNVALAQQEPGQTPAYGAGAYGVGNYAGGETGTANVDEQLTDQSVNQIYLPFVAKQDNSEQLTDQSVNQIYLPFVAKQDNSEQLLHREVNKIYLPVVIKEN